MITAAAGQMMCSRRFIAIVRLKLQFFHRQMMCIPEIGKKCCCFESISLKIHKKVCLFTSDQFSIKCSNFRLMLRYECVQFQVRWLLNNHICHFVQMIWQMQWL